MITKSAYLIRIAKAAFGGQPFWFFFFLFTNIILKFGHDDSKSFTKPHLISDRELCCSDFLLSLIIIIIIVTTLGKHRVEAWWKLSERAKPLQVGGHIFYHSEMLENFYSRFFLGHEGWGALEKLMWMSTLLRWLIRKYISWQFCVWLATRTAKAGSITPVCHIIWTWILQITLLTIVCHII